MKWSVWWDEVDKLQHWDLRLTKKSDGKHIFKHLSALWDSELHTEKKKHLVKGPWIMEAFLFALCKLVWLEGLQQLLNKRNQSGPESSCDWFEWSWSRTVRIMGWMDLKKNKTKKTPNLNSATRSKRLFKHVLIKQMRWVYTNRRWFKFEDKCEKWENEIQHYGSLWYAEQTDKPQLWGIS